MFGVRFLFEHWKARAKPFPNFVLDFVYIARTVDQHDATSFSRGEYAVSFANTFIKFSRLLFHSIGAARLSHSRLCRSSINIKHESKVWDAIADCKGIEALDHFAV